MKRIMSWLFVGALFTGVAGLGATACGGGEKEPPYVYNCGDVCSDYSECASELGASVDVAQCVSGCEAQAGTMPDYESVLESCQHCIWDAADCMGEVACSSTCMGLVPPAVPPAMMP